MLQTTRIIFYKIHTQDASNLKLELYAQTQIRDKIHFVINNKELFLCITGISVHRTVRSSLSFLILSPNRTCGNAFVSHDNEDLYLTAVSGEYDSYKLVVSKLSEKQELQSQIMAETSFLITGEYHSPTIYKWKWNERRATMFDNVYGRTYEYILATSDTETLLI